MNEEWRPIVGFEGIYEIRRDGLVRHILKCSRPSRDNKYRYMWNILNNTGYYAVHLSRPGWTGRKSLHRLLYEAFVEPLGERQIDHINGIRTDNRFENMRACIRDENRRNRKINSNNKSGLKGVYLLTIGGWSKWMASVSCAGKRNHLGCFDTKEEAALAYDKAAKELHGKFARTNSLKS